MGMPPEKQRWGIGSGQPFPPSTVSHQAITVAAVIMGKVGGLPTEMMLDSGSSVSLVKQGLLGKMEDIVQISSELQKQLQQVTASENH